MCLRWRPQYPAKTEARWGLLGPRGFCGIPRDYRCGRPLIVRWLPTLVWVIPLHTLIYLGRVRLQILLVNDSVIAVHERLNAGGAILGSSCDQCEAADHQPPDYIVQLS